MPLTSDFSWAKLFIYSACQVTNDPMYYFIVNIYVNVRKSLPHSAMGCNDKLGAFHANQISMCLNRVRLVP